MQIQTAGDAMNALDQLDTDLTNLGNSIPPGKTLLGTTDLADSAHSLVTQLQNRLDSVQLDVAFLDPSTQLNAQQLAEIQQLQQQVISDRALIGSTISSVDWTYGNFLDDTVSSVENEASQLVTAVTPSWPTWILIGAGIAIVVVLYRSL